MRRDRIGRRRAGPIGRAGVDGPSPDYWVGIARLRRVCLGHPRGSSLRPGNDFRDHVLLGYGGDNVLVDKAAHACVTGAGRSAAHHHRHDVPVVAPHRGDKIETRCLGVTRFDAVHTFDVAQQLIVIAHRLAVIREGGRRKVPIITWKALLYGATEQRLISRGRDLLVIGQARRVAINRATHADRMGLEGHHVSEFALAAADRFGDDDRRVVCGLRHQTANRILDFDQLSRFEPQFRRGLHGGVLGYWKRRVEPELAGIELLEQQIKGHDLGERGRMAQLVRVGGMQYITGIAVEHDRRIGWGGSGFMLAMPRFMLLVRGMRRVTRSGMACGRRISCDRNGEKADEAGANTRSSAQSRMICCQLCLPNSAIMPSILIEGYAPHCELPLNIAAAMPPLFRNRIASCR